MIISSIFSIFERLKNRKSKKQLKSEIENLKFEISDLKSQLESEKAAYKKPLAINVQKFNTQKLSAIYSTYDSDVHPVELKTAKTFMIDSLREQLTEMLNISTFTNYQTGGVDVIGSLYVVDKRDEV